jgi:fructokinase
VIVVGGEALVDLVPAPEGAFQPRLGGGPFNVAVALGRLGAPCALLAGVSTDAFGDAQLRRLEASTVDSSLVQRSGLPTALALASLGVGGAAEYTFYTAGTAALAVTDPGPLPAGVTAVALGSLGLVLPPGALAYEAVLRRESAAGRMIALDPNVRPALIDDRDAFVARFASWLPHVHLLKLSCDDVAWLAPAADPEAAAASWLGPRRTVDPDAGSHTAADPGAGGQRGKVDPGPRAVVLTRGGDGLTVLTRSGLRVSVPAVPVGVADTIGAGDTVQAALLARLHQLGALTRLDDLDAAAWLDVLGYAARAAAITCSRPGADPPWARELHNCG